jgi:hypothetical protein
MCNKVERGGFAEEVFPKDIKTILKMEDKRVKESIQAIWKTANIQGKFDDICNKAENLCQLYKNCYIGGIQIEKLLREIEELLKKNVDEFYAKVIEHITSQRRSIEQEIASHIKNLEAEFLEFKEFQNNLANLISEFGKTTPNILIQRLFKALDGTKIHYFDDPYDKFYQKWRHTVFSPNNSLTELRLGELVDIKKLQAESQANKEIEIKTGLTVQIDTDLGLVSLPLTYKTIDMAINSFQDPYIQQSCNTINLNLSHLPTIEYKFDLLRTNQLSKFSNLKEVSLTWTNLEKVRQCVQELQGLNQLESLKLDFFASESLDDAYINSLSQIIGNITTLKAISLNLSKS